jgi:cobalt-precorrin-5B (C1)-methyltransferase
MSGKVPERQRGGLRTGFTTGACAAAAAKAATRVLLQGVAIDKIESVLPNRQRVTFTLERCETHDDHVLASIIKDGGDDPDCTHGAEIVARVRRLADVGAEPGVVRIRGGEGVATVTKPGLGLTVGEAAINPVPRKNITEMVRDELANAPDLAIDVEISVPRGEELAKETTNARLGLLGGISILGTTGIVRPYSTAAFRASVIQAIDVAKERGLSEVVLTTGGKSEAYAMKLFPALPEDAFVQMGDFVGVALKHAKRRELKTVRIVGMMGKLSKMANGKMQTHVAGSEVNLELLAALAGQLGADEETRTLISQANTARHVLELCNERGLTGITDLICEKACFHGLAKIGGGLDLHAYLVDFNGALLGQHPPPPAADKPGELTP